MNELTHLDLFSGIGGFALAAQWAGFRTIGFCEIDKYCRRVIGKNFNAVPDAARQQAHVELQRSSEPSGQPRSAVEARAQAVRQTNGKAGHDNAPRFCSIFGNIFELDGKQFAGVTLITGGFPCQPFSCAGKRRGKEDNRHLWPEMLRVIKEARPTWVLGENVAGIVSMELDTVLSDLEGIGYACRPFIIPACAVDAKHRRNRVWIVANSIGNEHRQAQPRSTSAPGGIPQGERQARLQGGVNRRPKEWAVEPDVGRVAHGIPSRVDRLRGLGNAIVPQVAFEILKEIQLTNSEQLGIFERACLARSPKRGH